MNFKINNFFFIFLLFQISLTFSSIDPLIELNQARQDLKRDELQIWGEYWPDNFQSPLTPKAQASHWLVVAAFIGDFEKVNLYSSQVDDLDASVRIAARNLPIWNALMAAVIGNQPQIVKFLVLQGANKDKKIDDVYMIEQYTTFWGQKISDQFLNIKFDRNKAYSPLDIAKLLGNQDIINILENPQAPYVPVQQPQQQEPQKPIPVTPQKPTRVKQPEKIADRRLKIALEELNVTLLQLERVLLYSK